MSFICASLNQSHLFAYLSLDFPSFCRLIDGRDIIYCPSGQLCEEFSFSVSYIVDNVIENFPLGHAHDVGVQNRYKICNAIL